ncbi:MAG: hypothetical protein IIC54_01150 [Proteobacteria bacterium]|nr:hypothetical protein [Pseudomonadota bacterium]
MGNDRRGELVFFGALFVLALLMTLKYFPGLENPAAYAGNVFQAIHPDAFPGDPYIGPERSLWKKPFQLSLFYVLVKLGGEIWLDDRFTAAVYLGLVLAGMVGIDRIARLAGLGDVLPRLAVQLVYMRDHQALSHNVTFAHQQDVNHAAFAIPVIIWLIYATVARKSLWLILFLCLLLAGISIKNAPWVIAYCLIIAAVNGGKRDRVVVIGVFAAALAAFYVAVVHLFPIPAEDRITVWNLVFRYGEIGSDANPFYFTTPPYHPDLPTMLLKNAVFVGLCLSAVFVPGPDNAALRSLRIFVGLGLGVWLLGGLYMSFAPDGWKIPHVLPFSLVRSLGWPQTVAYLVIMICLFHWLRQDETVRRVLAATVVLGVLLVIGPGNHELWAALFVLSAAVVVAGHFVRGRMAAGGGEGGNAALGPLGGRIARRYPLVFVQALTLTIGVAFASTIWSRLPYWRTWAETGVFGYATSAEWIGVAEYFRQNTPKDASVLPLQYGLPSHPRSRDKLMAARYLATRSGRTTPVINELSDMFNLEGWYRELHQQELLRRVAEAFQAGWWDVAAHEVTQLVLVPDYIVLPSAIWDTQRRVSAVKIDVLPYAEEARVRDYVILRRVP